MMTCVSERSGMASSGMLRSAKMPAVMAAPVPNKIINLFRSEKSMTARSMDRYGLWFSGSAVGVGNGISALSLGAGISVIPQIGHFPEWLYLIVACSGIGQTYAVGAASVNRVTVFSRC